MSTLIGGRVGRDSAHPGLIAATIKREMSRAGPLESERQQIFDSGFACGSVEEVEGAYDGLLLVRRKA